MLEALITYSNFVIIPAIAYGSQLALGALGVTLLFGVLRFSNFAHGDTMAFGTAIVILTSWGLASLGVSLGPFPTALLALPVGILATILLVLLFDRWVYRYFREVKARPIIFTMVSVGVMFVTNGLVRMLIGTKSRDFDDGERFLISVKEFKEMTGLDTGLAIKMTQALTLIVAIIAMISLFYFLNKTRSGKAMRAYSDNEDLALLSGIEPDRVVLQTWILVAILATLAGTLYGLDKGFIPFNYFSLLLPIFASAILGGIGQPVGAILGAYIVAFSEVALTYAYKGVLIYLSPEFASSPELYQFLPTEYKYSVSFVILVIVLLVRPTGIIKGKVI